MTPGCAQCAALRQQIADLRKEYGQEFPDGDLPAVRALGFSPDQSRILLILFYANTWVSSRALEKRLDMTFDSLKTHICRMRRLHGGDLIETMYAVGYRLGMEGRLMVQEVVG